MSECPSEGVSESGGGFEGEWGIVRVGDCPLALLIHGMNQLFA